MVLSLQKVGIMKYLMALPGGVIITYIVISLIHFGSIATVAGAL